MAEPIRNYTPKRDVREELRRKVEDAPIEHADALLAAYELLQEAQDHGVLDVLRGLIGAGETVIGKAIEYANTPEGVRLMRNLLAMARLIGEVDPELLSSAAKAASRIRRQQQGNAAPSLWKILHRLTGRNSRRVLATIAGFADSFGQAAQEEGASAGISDARIPVIVPVIAVASIAVVVSYWVGRNGS